MNYIQPNVNTKTSEFGFPFANSNSSEKPISEISFADALKSAYQSEKSETETNETQKNAENVSENEETLVSKADDSSKKDEKSDKVEKEDKIADSKKIDDSKAKVAEENESDDSGISNRIVIAQNTVVKADEVVEDEDSEIAVDFDISSKVASNVAKENLGDVEESNVDLENNIVDLVAKNNDIQVENQILVDNKTNVELDVNLQQITVENTKIAKTEKSKSEKIENGFEKLSVHDLRTKKSDSDVEVKSAKISNTKVAKTEKEESTKDSKKTVLASKNTKTNDLMSLNQNVKSQKVVTQSELKNAYEQDSQENMRVTMELVADASQNITASSTQKASSNGSTFHQMLSNAVSQNAAEFVKAGNIILKDGNQGTINLIMKPESLGNVKISLSLSEKTISGQIVVASKEAYDAFRENIDAIRQAFTESGFDTGSLDLNFSNQQGFAQGENAETQAQNQKTSIANADKAYGDLVSSDDSDSAAYEKTDNHSVNIVA